MGLFLVVIFEIGEEHNKIRLENNEGRLQNRDQRGLAYLAAPLTHTLAACLSATVTAGAEHLSTLIQQD